MQPLTVKILQLGRTLLANRQRCSISTKQEVPDTFDGGTSVKNRSKTLQEPKRVITLVLSDVVPRRNPEFPVVFVTDSTQADDDVVLRRARGRKSFLRAEASGILAEGTSREFSNDAGALRQERADVRTRLAEAGYTVNPSEGRTFRIYVIETDNTRTGAPGRPWVYVGMTSKTADERVSEHLRGVPNRRGAGWRQFIHRNPSLEPDRNTFHSVTDAETEETRWGNELIRRGFYVTGPRNLIKQN